MPISNDTHSKLALALTSETAANEVEKSLASQLSVLSDVINNNATANTLADITGLSFNVEAGKRYKFKAMIAYDAAATTTGARFTVNGPASPTVLAVVSRYPLTATTETVNYVAAYDAPSAANATSLAAGNLAIVEGIIVPSANGIFKLQFASEVSGSAITVKAGSSMEINVVS